MIDKVAMALPSGWLFYTDSAGVAWLAGDLPCSQVARCACAGTPRTVSQGALNREARKRTRQTAYSGWSVFRSSTSSKPEHGILGRTRRPGTARTPAAAVAHNCHRHPGRVEPATSEAKMAASFRGVVMVGASEQRGRR
jgi:hypothetical protein